MLLSPVFIGMGAVVSGILNSYQRFTVPAIAPLIYNLAIIASAIFLAPVMGVEGLAVGVAVGSLLHLVVQLPNLGGVGQRYDLSIGLSHPGVRRVAWLMGPRMLGLAAGQINFIVSISLASGLPEGSITAYNYAFQLSQIPVGVLGVSVAVALFPTLSRDAALGRISEIRRQVSGSLRVLVFLGAPLTAIMIVLARPLAAVFFQYGLFSASSTERTAGALAFFSIGLVGHIVVHVLTRAFYAMQDTRTPVTWAVIAVAINVPLMIWLVGPMGVDGLALALSISAILEVIGLIWALHRRIESVDEGAVLRSTARSGISALAAALLMLGGVVVVEQWFGAILANGIGRLLVLALLSVAGVAIYLLVAAALRSTELDQVRSQLLGRLRRRRAA
jgi:putative peptidoglycan lipid II flippase